MVGDRLHLANHAYTAHASVQLTITLLFFRKLSVKITFTSIISPGDWTKERKRHVIKLRAEIHDLFVYSSFLKDG